MRRRSDKNAVLKPSRSKSMNNGSDQPAGNQDPNQDPLHYAPRWARDAQRPQGPSPTLRAARVEGESDAHNRFPLSGMNPAPVQRFPSAPPEPARRPFGVVLVTLLSFVSLVTVIAALIAVALNLRVSDTDPT